MMTTAEQLTQVFNDNFTAYFRSQVAHVNITGRNFYSDHKLLGEIYEDLQDQIDVLAELLRTIDEFMPRSLQSVIDGSHLDLDDVEGDADELLELVHNDLMHLKECYIELAEVASEEEHEDIENYAQERVLRLGKFMWMIKSTI